jgi:phospholipase/carboxylesterase
MRTSRRACMFAVAALLAAIPLAPAPAAGPELTARPPATPIANGDKRSGVLTLAGGAYAYLPKGLTGAPAPLLVSLYGAGGQPNQVLEVYRPYADQHGFVLLIPVSAKGTWDMIEDLKSRLGAEMNVQPRYGKDLKAMDSALAEIFTKVAIDPRKVGIAGFSDGATYALSVGTANSDLFKTVIAFSPGPAFVGRNVEGQNIFISHGENDKVLPFATARGHAARLRVKKANVAFERFGGGHEVPKDIREKALAFFKDPASASPESTSGSSN